MRILRLSCGSRFGARSVDVSSGMRTVGESRAADSNDPVGRSARVPGPHLIQTLTSTPAPAPHYVAARAHCRTEGPA